MIRKEGWREKERETEAKRKKTRRRQEEEEGKKGPPPLSLLLLYSRVRSSPALRATSSRFASRRETVSVFLFCFEFFCCCFPQKSFLREGSRGFSSSSSSKHATSSFEFLSPPKKLPLSLVLSLSLSLFLLACASSSTVTPTSPRKLETSERVRPSRKKRSEQKKITSERRDSAPVLQSRGVGALPGRRRPLADAGLRVGELRGELSQVDPVGGGGHGVLSQELLLIATAKKNGKERRGVKLKD